MKGRWLIISRKGWLRTPSRSGGGIFNGVDTLLGFDLLMIENDCREIEILGFLSNVELMEFQRSFRL